MALARRLLRRTAAALFLFLSCAAAFRQLPVMKDEASMQMHKVARLKQMKDAASGFTDVDVTARREESQSQLVDVGASRRVGRSRAPKGRTADRCFCLYAGGCLEKFPECKSKAGQAFIECQSKQCGMRTLLSDQNAVSFFASKKRADLLTIPKQFFKHIDDMKARSKDVQALLTNILEQGREAYKKHKGKQAEWQCFNPSWRISVPWFHMHTFSGQRMKEGLPTKSPRATCHQVGKSAAEAAKWMINAPQKKGAKPVSAGKSSRRSSRSSVGARKGRRAAGKSRPASAPSPAGALSSAAPAARAKAAGAGSSSSSHSSSKADGGVIGALPLPASIKKIWDALNR